MGERMLDDPLYVVETVAAASLPDDAREVLQAIDRHNQCMLQLVGIPADQMRRESVAPKSAWCLRRK